ncbi:hypothetical protein [Nocardioides sp. GY 10113]|uniref:hypothetical protein n=1 Tax=Nocardioides sp. GY 10113 TaxID=2569761 RepID=UPI001457ED0A|nr:hypothetical protein [Nocardioides sp. GY 10113]
MTTNAARPLPDETAPAKERIYRSEELAEAISALLAGRPSEMTEATFVSSPRTSRILE